MIGMIGTGSGANLIEVRTRTLFPGMRFRFGLKVCQDPARPLRDGGMTARDDLSDHIQTDAGRIDPHDPHDCGGGSSDGGRNTAKREDDRTGGSGSETGELALPSMTSYYAMRPHTTYTCGVYVFVWIFLPFGPVLAFYSYVLIWGRSFVLFVRQNRRKWMAVDGGWADAPPLVRELAFWFLLLSKETKETAHAWIQGRVRA